MTPPLNVAETVLFCTKNTLVASLVPVIVLPFRLKVRDFVNLISFAVVSFKSSIVSPSSASSTAAANVAYSLYPIFATLSFAAKAIVGINTITMITLKNVTNSFFIFLPPSSKICSFTIPPPPVVLSKI